MSITRVGRRLVQLLLILSASVPAAVALERPSAEEVERYRKDGSWRERVERAREIGNHKVKPGLAANAAYRLQKEQWRQGRVSEPPTPPPAWQGMPTTGTVRIFALLIAFSDYPFSNANTSIDAKLFGDGSGVAPYESVRNFYRRASYNQLELTGATLGWYTTAYPRSSVVQTIAGRQNLIKEALNSIEAAGHDFSQYDNDGDGDIDYFVVIWTGPAGAWASFWWGYQTSFSEVSYLLDGKRLLDYSWQWEANPAGGTFTPRVVIHETGHALGLPDYYDYDDTVGPDGGVGGLDQMDANWGDHNCFSKFLLDWITPTVIPGGTNLATLNSSGTSQTQNAYLFAKGATSASFAEYFMVQNRNQDGNDTTHPGSGLLIWHVDATLDEWGWNYLNDNSYTDHKLLRLMEADGLEEIESNYWAESGDYYVSGKTLSPTTTPSIAKYDGTPNPMKVWSISALGSPMTAQIDEIADATAPTGVPGTPSDEGATTTSTDLTFTWTKGTLADPETGIAGYDLQVGTTAGGADLYDGSLGNVLGRTVANAQDSFTYYARVRGANGTGLKSSWSSSSDGITVSLPTVSCAALDNCSLVFKTGGSASWFEQSTVSYYGGSAAQSADIGDNQASFMQTTVVGPGSFKFWWRVSSEAGWDFLRVYVDGVASGSGISGETTWAQRTLSIAAGSHVVKWVYAKDVIISSGSDAGWVDRVEWVPTGPSLSINDVSVSEGDAGTKTASFTVTLSPASSSTVTVSYATANGTATTADGDYVSASGILTFSPGATTGPVNVTVNGDTQNEANETFYVNLSTASNATIADSQGLGTITNDDPLPALSINDVSVTEGNAGGTPAGFTVTLSAVSGRTVTVGYGTADDTASAASGDYAAAFGMLTFAPGVTTRPLSVTLNGDIVDEPNELFRMTLSIPTNATVSKAQGLGEIVDDDGIGGPASAPPVELSHGFTAQWSLAALPGPVQEQHFFLIEQKPYSSYEVVVDGISGDLGAAPGSPLDVALIASDGTTVLRDAEDASTLGHARSLRWASAAAGAVGNQRIRIRSGSGSCTTDCGTDDRYRLRAYETTYAIPRFNNAGTQATVLVIQNPTTDLVNGTVYFWAPTGTLLASQAFSIAARATLVLSTAGVAGAAGRSGALTIASDAPYGALSGKTVALEAATGYSFDSPMVPRAVR